MVWLKVRTSPGRTLQDLNSPPTPHNSAGHSAHTKKIILPDT